LYEATREYLRAMGCRALFFDVPPDDKEKLKDPAPLAQNRRRMRFYEQHGARPIIGTLYDSVPNKANQGYFTYLLYDKMDPKSELKARQLKALITRILSIKGDMSPDDENLRCILNSIRDPVAIRPPRYLGHPLAVSAQSLRQLLLVSTGDAHHIHHVKERGYEERPARIPSILQGLAGIPCQTVHIRKFPDKHILEVHNPGLVRFLKTAARELRPGQLLYPTVFPVRRPERVPKNWEMQAGYYCIDTFTPVTGNAYLAARTAANAALTGADAVANGAGDCYVLCRPPGHHAESRVFGGFCYLNSAAIAAQFLSRLGKVAFIDIDHHHGNGSQEIFYERSDVYFISIHGHPQSCYPYFAGYADETGKGAGKGYNRNYPLFPGVDDARYLTHLRDALAQFRAFGPKFLVVSLGFDIMRGDPTGSFDLTKEGMAAIGKELADFCLPTLIVQEGGYSLRNLKIGTQFFFRGFLAKRD